MARRFGIDGRRLRVAAAALLVLSSAAPARAAWSDDWRASADELARRAAELSERELRNRHLPVEVAPALAATIRMTRNRAHASGVRRMPEHVVQALSPYFPTAVLRQVRWRPPMPRPSMSGLLVNWYFREGAVTLEDVVLFSDERLAQDPGFWAHELTHVEQYRRYGVDGFARRYVADWRKLEAEARTKSNRIKASLRSRRTGSW